MVQVTSSHKRQLPLRGGRNTNVPIIPFGLAVSLLAAVLIPLLSATTVQLAVCIGLLGVTATLSWDHFRRFLRRIEAENQHSPLLTIIESRPDLAESLRAIANSAREIIRRAGDRGVLVERLMTAKLSDAVNYLQGLNRGEARVSVRPVGPMLQLMEVVKNNVMATTIPESDDGWWRSTEGKEYLDLNRRAKERGVKVERIVLWQEISQEFARMVHEQRGAGVTLRFAKLDGTSGVRTNLAIYDGQIYQEVVYDANRTPHAYDYCDIPERVKEKIKQYEDLKSSPDLPNGLDALLSREESSTP